MADTIFNPNELVLERIRAVEEVDPATSEVTGRYTQIGDPSLSTSADSTVVEDAMGSEIARFYRAQTGTFSFTNALFSLDLAASQFGTKKEIATSDKKIITYYSEIVTLKENEIDKSVTATLKYTPYGVENAEIKYVKLINDNNTFGKTYEVSSATGEGKFTIDAENKKLTFSEGTTGKIFVQYARETEKAVKVSKRTDSVPEVKTLVIHALFHDPCDTNKVYAGVIYVPRAMQNIESVELALTSDGGHSAEYILQKPYCDEDAKLFDIIVSED